jgi:glycosyltransferase involved in cell wall biosynthesis/SAM-dependent methyltransferase
MDSLPFVTCVMPTANRRSFVKQAVRYFLAQDYPKKELVIVEDGANSVRDLVPENESVRFFRLEGPHSVGAKRNFAGQQAGGEILVHWDDDDWSASWRLRYQVEQLCAAQADICGLNRVWFYAPEERRVWEYVYPAGGRPWVYGASLAYRRAFWENHRFAEINVGEDARFVWADARAKIHVLSDSRFLVARVHAGNTSSKHTADARYQPRPVAEMERLLGVDHARFAQPLRAPGLAAPAKPSALVSAALGVGDILRVTPLIRALHRLGYEVDALLATDYPDVARLVEGAPELRRVFQVPSRRCQDLQARDAGLEEREYAVATFTTWSATLRGRVRAKRVLTFDRAKWLVEGDSPSVARIARELGWTGEMPEPFVVASGRRFGLPTGTIALHPGCKAEWPWKKWHGFDELARRFPNVVILGSEEDRRTEGTYFNRPFAWPDHARDFTGELALPDTAALLRECSALVSNDSGLMHLAVAIGIPTFGIFGITSPAREAIAAKNFFPITKGLSCEPACRQGAWGRRDCEHHLRCLKTLSPDEVLMKMSATLPELKENSVSPTVRPASLQLKNGHAPIRQTINVAYHGYVFDASGYGQAARAYIHALHLAGVELRVLDLGAHHPRQVEDPLVASLLGRSIDADFHLFHGTPAQWARLAFPLRNVIAMTVWETDTMPTQWRPVLNHAMDVWLPCEFNTTVFSAALGKPVFKLPHPVLPPRPDKGVAPEAIQEWDIRTGDFVFYAIFEWQDRKSPERTMEAYLRAFPEETETVLVLKTNPGAATVARRALEEMRGRTGSRARVSVFPEAWSETQIEALHARGHCYVSLHRGEGWGYPLFEAASRGKMVIATGYSGPLDYLAADHPGLVRHTLTAVRQAYAYYRPSMRWAEPDTAHASELMRAVRAQPDPARARAADAAKVLARDFSLEAIGERAKRRLHELLRRTNNAKWEHLSRSRRDIELRPPVPIPGDWFDADYFENGLKSNWTNGYHWRDFAGLFRETAQFLTAMFPEAASFLDAGCAKGFLVRALRELGKDARGFDHSVWAIERAEESARAFLSQASAERAEFDRSFDVTLAFSLLENLTEEQALEFFVRARAWTRQAFVAVVLTCEHDEKRTQILANDRDLSHLTLQSRAWWHERFLRAGWLQDPLHRVAERACRAHALPQRMGWEIFVYSPTDRANVSEPKP